ncbi:MAG: TonB-dependent receptor [Bacteroidales bacterium]|nr:TonB-dependent receptor [Bacteroidales bacterium]
MRTFAIFLTVMSLFSSATNGQYTIRGTVTDARTGESLPGAHVFIPGTYVSTITMISGAYRLTGLQKGTYMISFSFLGYLDVSREVELPKDTVLSISMEVSPVFQEEVIITASRMKEGFTSTYTEVSRDEISADNTGKDLPWLIGLTPSVITTSDAGTGVGYTSFRIRGTDPQRINVTLNGIPLNDAESHQVYWVDLPDLAASTENLQIQRGVGTSMNGAAAFGGSVNILTSGLNDTPYARFESAAGSFNTFRNSVRAGTGLIRNRFSFDTRLSKITSDGFIDRAFSDLESLHLAAGYHGARNVIMFNLLSGNEKTYQAWAGVPADTLKTHRTYNPFTYENQTDNYRQNHFQLLYSGELKRNMLLNAVLHYTYGSGYFEEFQDTGNPWAVTSLAYYGIDPVVSGTDTLFNTDLIRRKWLDNDLYGSNVSLVFNKRRMEFIAGGGLLIYRGRSFGNVIWSRFAGNSFINHPWYASTGEKNDYSVFTRLSMWINDRMSFFADIQYRGIDYVINGSEDGYSDVSQEHHFSFFNPKTGISLSVSPDTRIFWSMAVAHREPARQNYIDIMGTGDIPSHEILYDLEVGWSMQKGRMMAQTNVYYMYYRDQLVATGEINNVGYPVLRNVERSYRAGLEMVLGIKILRNLKWDFNMTLSRNRILDFEENIFDFGTGSVVNTTYDETPVSFSPEILAGSLLSFTPGKVFSSSLRTKYVGRQFLDNSGDRNRSVNPYLVSDIRMEAAIRQHLFDKLSLFLQVFNIFDEKFETHGWVYRYAYGGDYYSDISYYPQAGMHFMAGLSACF